MDRPTFDVKKSQKAVDDVYALYLARPVSKRITRLLFNTRITANQISILSFFLGMFSAVFLFFDYSYVSAIFLYLSFIFDCVDGELARSKEQFTKLGFWIEGTLDRIPDIVPILAMGYLTNEWFLVSLTIMNFCLIRTAVSTNAMMVEKLGLEISNKGKGLYSVSGVTAWLKYTKSTHLVFLIIFVLIRQYRLYLTLFSTLGFLYFLIIWLVGHNRCKELDAEERK